ncbi:hypothetical protein [Clostridium sp.]|uniref:hypothetical protein n=1 Tax=Clostridium sp. TaxID=1506 RepID=UPI002903B51A|nr:hypothetical protein [Clostridium sp.]MDU2156679.1 hypothetical protein [Clostridium sp.]
MNFNDDDSILYSDDSRLRPPPLGNLVPGFPTPGPGPAPSPGGNFSFPGSQGAPPMGSNLNIGPPPNFTPSKNSSGVQKLSSSGGPQTKAVSPGSISFCLFKFTYIWETSGRNYWAFLLNVDRRSVSGLRWFRNTWVFFGLDLRRIDSFICYRSDSKCDSDLENDLTSENDSTQETLINNRKEYSVDGIKNTYTKVLTSVEIPEIKNDYIINYLGEVDGNELTTRIPCKQTRVTNYRIVLELTYPDEFNKQLIDKINSCAIEASTVASRYLDEFRDTKNFLTPLEVFNSSAKQIGKSIKVFSSEFTNKLKKLKLPREITKEVEYTILQEKIEEPWRIL